MKQPSNLSCDSLFVSPHLDDVVLSCALRIIQERDAGNKIVVATIFSDDNNPPFQKSAPSIRRDEDLEALKALALATDPIWLGFKDAPVRHSYYNGFVPIVLGQHEADHLIPPQIATAIETLMHELSPRQIYLPLAIGRHVDHRLTYEGCRLAISKYLLQEATGYVPSSLNSSGRDTNNPESQRNCRVYFYEDRPYTFVPGNLELAFEETGLRSTETPIDSARTDQMTADQIPKTSILQALMAGLNSVTFFKNVIKNRQEVFRYALFAARRMNRTNPTYKILDADDADAHADDDAVANPKVTLRKWTGTQYQPSPLIAAETTTTTSPKDLQAIEQSILAYTSQFEVLYSCIDTFRAESRAYSRSLDDSCLYAERYWKLLDERH